MTAEFVSRSGGGKRRWIDSIGWTNTGAGSCWDRDWNTSSWVWNANDLERLIELAADDTSEVEVSVSVGEESSGVSLDLLQAETST